MRSDRRGDGHNARMDLPVPPTAKPRCAGFRRGWVMVCAAAVLTGCGGNGASRSGAPSNSAPPVASSTGAVVDHGDLPARWWQWSESMDPARNPIDDPTGSSCALNQPADIWFLAGTHGGKAARTCTVTSGRPIYFPVVNQVCTVTAGQSDAAAASACRAATEIATATLDGRPVAVVEGTSEGSFRLVSPAGSRAFAAGTHKVVAWGLWAGPITLSPGRHAVTLHGKAGRFETEVTYTLTAR
jgi:ABC-type Fe3+-hydroxamate transport system substrate-binding protein